MEEEKRLADYLDELDLIADSLFAALRRFLLIDAELNKDEPFYTTHYADEAWRSVPNNIRAVLLALVYATYMDSDPIPDTLVQWRKDIYTELDEVATKPLHLRKIK